MGDVMMLDQLGGMLDGPMGRFSTGARHLDGHCWEGRYVAVREQNQNLGRVEGSLHIHRRNERSLFFSSFLGPRLFRGLVRVSDANANGIELRDR